MLHRSSLALPALLLVTALASCSPAASKPALSAANLPDVATWTGPIRTVFDDGMDLGLANLATEPASAEDPDFDALLPKRLRGAEGVVTAKILGVDSEYQHGKIHFRVHLAVEGDTLLGRRPEEPFDLLVEPEAQCFGVFRANSEKLINRPVIVFYRRYRAAEDSVVTHFHLSPHNKQTLESIQLAITKVQFE